MNSNLKPGDLCLIIGALHFHENIGKTCELIEPLQPGHYFTAPDGTRMIFPEDYEPSWLIVGDGIVGRREYARGTYLSRVEKTHDWGICLTRFLMPLRGEREPLKQSLREEQPA